MYYVYVLKSKLYNQIYTGSTNDLIKRIKRHNSGKEISTKRYRPWTIQYYEAYKTEELARQREKRLKYHGNAMRELKKRIGLKVGLPSTTFKNNKSGAGFTLIEVLISALIFVVVISVAMGVFVTNSTVTDKSKAIRDLSQSARYAFEAIGREVKDCKSLEINTNSDFTIIARDGIEKRYYLYQREIYVEEDGQRINLFPDKFVVTNFLVDNKTEELENPLLTIELGVEYDVGNSGKSVEKYNQEYETSFTNRHYPQSGFGMPTTP